MQADNNNEEITPELLERMNKAIDVDWSKVKPEDILTPEQWKQRIDSRRKDHGK